MVQLAPYLMADSVESYRTDAIDGDSIEAVFDPPELEEGLAFRQSIPDDLTQPPARLVAGLRPAQRDRAIGQRPHRRARVDLGGAHRRRGVGRRRDRHARARRRPDRLHRLEVPAPRPADARRRRGRRRREHAQDPPRVRARHHVPVRAGVRLQRALQVLQERRERAVQVHPHGAPHALRRQRQPRVGDREHHRRGLRGDAAAVRRPLVARQPPGRRAVDGSLHRQDQAGDERRDHRRPRDRPDPARSLPGAQRDQPAVVRRGPERPPVRHARPSSSPATRPSARRTSSRSRWVSSARCTWRA